MGRQLHNCVVSEGTTTLFLAAIYDLQYLKYVVIMQEPDNDLLDGGQRSWVFER